MNEKFFSGKDICEAITELFERIGAMPAADVVQVIRCNDCAIPHNRWTGCPRMNGTIMEPDDYCSYGERKEGEE